MRLLFVQIECAYSFTYFFARRGAIGDLKILVHANVAAWSNRRLTYCFRYSRPRRMRSLRLNSRKKHKRRRKAPAVVKPKRRLVQIATVSTYNITSMSFWLTLSCCFVLQKWSKGKVRDKLNNQVLFDKATYEKLLKEVPSYKLITPAVVSERLKIRGSLARRALVELRDKGLSLFLFYSIFFYTRWL